MELGEATTGGGKVVTTVSFSQAEAAELLNGGGSVLKDTYGGGALKGQIDDAAARTFDAAGAVYNAIGERWAGRP